MILDAGHSVFAWFGALSTRQEQQESVRIAREYLESCPNDRDVDTPVIKIRMGLEPPNFTGFFGSWDEARWGVVDIEDDLISNQPLGGILRCFTPTKR